MQQFGDVSVLDTPTILLWNASWVKKLKLKLKQEKHLIVKLVSVGQPQADGTRVVYFELNGQPREVVIKDESIKATVADKSKR